MDAVVGFAIQRQAPSRQRCSSLLSKTIAVVYVVFALMVLDFCVLALDLCCRVWLFGLCALGLGLAIRSSRARGSALTRSSRGFGSAYTRLTSTYVHSVASIFSRSALALALGLCVRSAWLGVWLGARDRLDALDFCARSALGLSFGLCALAFYVSLGCAWLVCSTFGVSLACARSRFG